MEINYHNIESYDISTKCRIDGNKIIPFLLKMSELYNLDLCIMSKDLNIIINFKNNFQEKPTIYVSDMINFGACTERFVLISIILMKIYNNFNHSNILLFDLKNKTAEHFEPHGVFKVKSIDINNSIIINKIVNKVLRKIFMFFGSLGIICYIGHLAYIFSDSLMFSYVLGTVGFSIIVLATFLMHSRKSRRIN